MELSGGIVRQALRATGRTVGTVAELTREAAGQLPRLMRLERIQANTRISLGRLVDERRRTAPNEIFFLFGDRAYTARDINERNDNVVRGLIEIGIHHGERVGVLMSARPTALALAIAINRLGGVTVMLRPDGDLETEAALAERRLIIADPERAPQAAGIATVHDFVLGGAVAGGDPGCSSARHADRRVAAHPDALPAGPRTRALRRDVRRGRSSSRFRASGGRRPDGHAAGARTVRPPGIWIARRACIGP